MIDCGRKVCAKERSRLIVGIIRDSPGLAKQKPMEGNEYSCTDLTQKLTKSLPPFNYYPKE